MSALSQKNFVPLWTPLVQLKLPPFPTFYVSILTHLKHSQTRKDKELFCSSLKLHLFLSRTLISSVIINPLHGYVHVLFSFYVFMFFHWFHNFYLTCMCCGVCGRWVCHLKRCFSRSGQSFYFTLYYFFVFFTSYFHFIYDFFYFWTLHFFYT